MKKCSRCTFFKEFSEFGFKKKGSQSRYAECADCLKVRSKNYRLRNLERCKEKSRISARKHYINNREEALRKNKIRASTPEAKKASRERSRKYRAENINCAMRIRIGGQLRKGLRAAKSNRQAFSLLGYSRDELKVHLEKQFTKGMDWGEFLLGKIHIDHIVPLSSFDLSSDEGVARAWALPNLRPTWAIDNIRKGKSRVFLL